MKHSLTIAGTLFFAIAASTSAEAQQVGTYTGTSADGQYLDFTVGTDPNTNSLAVLEAGINFDAVCKGGYPNLLQSWGLGFTQDITDRKAAIVFPGQDIYVTANLVFSGNGNTVTGTITTRVVAFAPSTAAPTKAEFCESAKQAFTATYSADAAKPPTLAPGTTIHYPPAAK
ncbi:MAG: hypothetical protein ABSA49_01110 [Rhizomicrobium sp.]|jgi:hypothetical protein